MDERTEDWSGLETELRAATPRPRPRFEASLARRVRAARPGPAAGVRVAVGLAATVATLGVFAGLGGLAHAAGAARKVAKVVAAPAAAARPPAAPQAAAPPQAAAVPGMITICHATGSATNPYVEITISTAGLAGHGGHSGDIIPAPPGGCPPPPGDPVGEDQYGQKVTICHRTRSARKPYVLITVSVNAIPAHQRHDDPPDIIPAPPGGCPGG